MFLFEAVVTKCNRFHAHQTQIKKLGNFGLIEAARSQTLWASGPTVSC